MGEFIFKLLNLLPARRGEVFEYIHQGCGLFILRNRIHFINNLPKKALH